MTYLQVAQLGHSILRKKTKLVKNFDDPILQQLIDNMIETCVDVNGVGIAAPQVYQSLKLFILASRKNPRYPHAPNMKPLAMINPRIISPLPLNNTMTKDWEGCLSIPGVRGLVPRMDQITIS